MTPLHVAAEGGHVEIVKFLVGKGAKVDATDQSGVSTVVSTLTLKILITSEDAKERIYVYTLTCYTPRYKKEFYM